MPHLLNVQQFEAPDLRPAWFLPPEQARRQPRPERAPAYAMSASALSMAPRERQDVTAIRQLLAYILSRQTSTSLREPQDVIAIWQQGGTSTILVPLYQVRSLEQIYTFRRPEEVSWFLQVHPFLVPLLVEAYGKIATCFGPYPEVALEVVTDPEAVDDRQLVAFIRTDLHPAKALASLDRLDKGWWLEAAHRSRGKLCIHLEYR